jgi:hypothetical protein
VGRNRGDTAARMRAKQKKTGLAYVVLDNKGISSLCPDHLFICFIVYFALFVLIVFEQLCFWKMLF